MSIKQKGLLITYILFLILIVVSCISGPAPVSIDECSHYVDNEAQIDGDGSLESPWISIAEHVNDLEPDDTICVRGNMVEPSRIYTESLIICNSAGTASEPIAIRAYPGESVTICVTGSQNIFRIRGDHWIIADLTLEKPGGGIAILVEGGNYNIIQDCEIQGGTYRGILLAGASNNIIRDNYIYNFLGRAYVDGIGILLSDGCHDNIIIDNEIYDCGDGVQIYVPNSGEPGDYNISGNIIQNNHIWVSPENASCCENAVDIKAGNPTITDNIFHGFRNCDGSCGSTGSAGEAVLIHGQLVNTVTVSHNEIYNSAAGIRVHYTTDATVAIDHNLIHDLTLDPASWLHAAIITGDGGGYHLITHNTIANCPDHNPFVLYGRDHSIFNNLIYSTAHTRHGSVLPVADYNGWFAVSAWDDYAGPHDTVGDNPILTANYRLTENNPARGRGQSGTDLGAFAYETPGIETPTPTDGEWWEHCTSCPTYLIQPTYTPEYTPTCRPCQPSP
ncbi:MAG: right-handed parallel beta-helix repeat-containing protein, partial [Candidatus Marinimicrobia bacterium]|nr:right-handed parallel beta-helix repeat-containing protein [Candidatus Neomarinimicrobiota bacterium]